MRWKTLAAVLAVVLLAAIVFAIAGSRGVTAPPGAGPAALDAPPDPPSAGSPVSTSVTPSPSVANAPRSAPVQAPERAAAPAAVPVQAPVAVQPASEPGIASATPPEEALADAGVPFAINKDGIKSAIHEKIPELRDCYDSWLQADPSLAGRIKVSFTIDTDADSGLGVVTKIGVMDGGIDQLALQGCVLNVFQELSFEAPENGPVTVNYPLRFESSDAG